VHSAGPVNLPIADVAYLCPFAMKTIGIIREGKIPPDQRTPLTPHHCVDLLQKFPELRIIVQSSEHRCFSDDDYKARGIEVVQDVSEADILLGVKEVPVADLVPGKTYLFFSHTIKKQAYNRKLLRAILERKIRLIDYETLVWDTGNRIIGFGRFAGIVGTHHALRMWGRRHELFHLVQAAQCRDMDHLYEQYEGIRLNNMKIALCGDGRVAHGAIEFLKKLRVHHVSQEEFLANEYDEAVYVTLRSEDYYARRDGREWDKADFYKHPEEYMGTFAPYYKTADIMINAVFWKQGIPPFFTRDDMKSKEFRIRTISDITCDIPGPLPSTLRTSTIEDPVYGYNQYLESETKPYQKQYVDVQAVSNLPCELPVDASIEFGDQLVRYVLPNLLIEDRGDIIKLATITEDGGLTTGFEYLRDYVE
jgi:alanine dehydrogenase